MLQRTAAPAFVGRQEELSRLEDALLAANRGDGRFVLLAGEAGIGKTRLATELARRARKLGFGVLWGSCAEAEIALPYLPFVEAIGNELGESDVALLRSELGPLAAELGQLFPQLGTGLPAPGGTDAGQAKLRLFESVVALLEVWARERGLLLVLDDVHWADGSTRELLDYVARRARRRRILAVASYRSDELDRRHPLTRVVQVWRRAGLADVVPLAPISAADVAEIVGAILDTEEVGEEFARLVHARADGNPFVLEEMLREALDRGDLVRRDSGWERPPLDALRLPETVRDVVLLRLARLDAAEVEVLRAAAVLGRSFDHHLLVEVTDAGAEQVLAALEAAVAQQLVVEDATGSGRYSWRHALTQEAIASDTVVPKRQAIHSRAADALLRRGGSAIVVAHHLLEAGRGSEAVDACRRGADEAEAAVAYGEAAQLLERALPYVADPGERAHVLARVGRLRWTNNEPAAGEQLLVESVRQFDALGLRLDAARARVHLGRCRWELDRPDEALEDFETARAALEEAGPSPELALAQIRIAGLYAFQLEYDRCRDVAERAVRIAEDAGAELERVWAASFVALGLFGTAREFALLDRCYEEAIAGGYSIIAGNILHNEVWDRVHSLAGGLRAPLEKIETMPFHPWASTGTAVAKSWALLALGRPREALAQARALAARLESAGAQKFLWRARLAAAEALAELDRAEEGAQELPPPAPGNERQDVVYDTPARIRVALGLGRLEEAAELARRAAADDGVLQFREPVALAVEALVEAGDLAGAHAVVERARSVPVETGRAGLALAEGRLLLARGKADASRALLEHAARELDAAELPLHAWRAWVLAGRAAAEAGDVRTARAHLTSVVEGAARAGAGRIRAEALLAASRVGLDLSGVAETARADAGEPQVLPAGERLVTSLFADVRGYTERAATGTPEETAETLTALHRLAAAEIAKRNGIVDKFAGDAVMATFNAVRARVDHAVLALEAAFALRDKAALMDLPVGIGISAGAAVVTRSLDDANVSVLGSTTNLAARLQSAAGAGEILLSDEAFRRVAAWLEERGLAAEEEALELKGFEAPQRAYRIRAPAASA